MRVPPNDREPSIVYMKRREFFQLSALGSATIWTYSSENSGNASAPMIHTRDFEWDETTIGELQRRMDRRKLTATALTRAYLARIKDVDRNGPGINAVIEINPDALAIARSLDKERKGKGPRGPLHGIPILLKDNIDTRDRMMTTAGSLALIGSIPPRDAFLVERLRQAGAVILGKTNLSEWANFRSNRSTSGWSGRGGLTKNPYVLDRNTSGSSSGSAAAVAANLCVAAIGTETDGSIISPCTYCGIVGLKPTVGLISRSGIIPISQSQDTAGPMARSVRDVAILLGVLTGMDSRDEITTRSSGNAHADYTRFLQDNGLRGARIGVARQFFRSRNERAARVVEGALKTLQTAGAELIDPVNLPSFGKLGDSEFQVMLHEFKDGLNRYFGSLGTTAPIKTLAELIQFNEDHKEKEMPYFGQETLIRAEEKGPLTDQAYRDALEKCRRLSRDEGLDAVMNEHRLDAIVAPSGGPAHRTDMLYGNRDTGGSSSPAAVAGYPSITVPAGHLHGLPLGISFFGRAWSEPTLLKIAHGFEQAGKARTKPRFLRTITQS